MSVNKKQSAGTPKANPVGGDKILGLDSENSFENALFTIDGINNVPRLVNLVEVDIQSKLPDRVVATIGSVGAQGGSALFNLTYSPASPANPFVTGQTVKNTGFFQSTYNGFFVITMQSLTSFTAVDAVTGFPIGDVGSDRGASERTL